MLTVNTPKPFLSTAFLPNHHLHHLPPSSNPNKASKPLSISALILPSSYDSAPSKKKQQLQVYQPYRPPPSPIPARFRTLDTNARIDILSNRLGLWFEYAPLIPALIDDGFTSSTLEEITGIPSVEQNLLIVARQVRDSLVEVADTDTVSYFDPPGSPEILYELRVLNTPQRAAAARFVINFGFDAKRAEELSRSMKDFPRRCGERGWEHFDYDSPGDCLAFMYYRQAFEHKTASTPELRRAMLEKSLEVVETERARQVVLDDLEGKATTEAEVESELDVVVKVPVVRLVYGEVAESSSVVVLPVCRAEEREMEVQEAPWECGMVGEFGVVQAEKGWSRWVVLPGWLPVLGLNRGGVAVAFPKAKHALQWKEKKQNAAEEILVVADRGRKEVEVDDAFYLVVSGGNGSGDEALKVQPGAKLKKIGVETSLGTVVLIVRPPREDDDHIRDEDWD